MAWRIEVAASARAGLGALDPSLLLELRERVADIADDPLHHLRRSHGANEPPDTLVLDYVSDVIRDLRIRVFFAEPDVARRRIIVVGAGHVSDAEGDGD